MLHRDMQSLCFLLTLLRWITCLTSQIPMQALRLVKHIASKGSPELRRAILRQSSEVKSLTQFRCAPDPFKGDIPWKRVQEYASEALAAMHAAPQEQQLQQQGSSLGVSVQAAFWAYVPPPPFPPAFPWPPA